MICCIEGTEGKWSLWAASRSPGAPNVTVGAPNVTPNNEASDPPNECPVRSKSEGSASSANWKCCQLGKELTSKPDVRVGIHVCDAVVQILEANQ